MHRGRFGGNARKRKAKLTDDTFQAMIGSSALAEAPLATMEIVVETEAVMVLSEGVAVAGQAPTEYPPAERTRQPREFRCQEYRFGYAVCRNCQNDQAYYVHQADMESGYTFRCRVCRHEVTVTAQA